MFKKSLVSLALALAWSFAAAQLVVGQEVVVGLKGGINVADLSIEDDGTSVESDTRSGFVGGVFAQFGLGEVFAIRPEALFSRKGTKSQDEGLLFQADLDYIEFPVLLVARVPTGGMVRPYAAAGPVISLEANCDLVTEGFNGPIAQDCETFNPEDPLLTKSADFGVAFGGGVEIGFERLLFLLDGRYTLGLTDINDTASAPESFKNRAWSFTAGAGIRIN